MPLNYSLWLPLLSYIAESWPIVLDAAVVLLVVAALAGGWLRWTALVLALTWLTYDLQSLLLHELEHTIGGLPSS